MNDYGRVRSTVYPEAVNLDEYSAWITSDVIEIEVTHEEETHTEYEYNLIQYTKNEYIEMLTQTNAKARADIDYVAMMTDVDIPEE